MPLNVTYISVVFKTVTENAYLSEIEYLLLLKLVRELSFFSVMNEIKDE